MNGGASGDDGMSDLNGGASGDDGMSDLNGGASGDDVIKIKHIKWIDIMRAYYTLSSMYSTKHTTHCESSIDIN